MADDRIFRVTRNNGRTTFGYRKNLSAQLGGQKKRHYNGTILKIEATNADATEGWTDVTREFLGHPRSEFEIMCDPMGNE